MAAGEVEGAGNPEKKGQAQGWVRGLGRKQPEPQILPLHTPGRFPEVFRRSHTAALSPKPGGVIQEVVAGLGLRPRFRVPGLCV